MLKEVLKLLARDIVVVILTAVFVCASIALIMCITDSTIG